MEQLQFHTFESSRGVARITFARPKHNVLNIPMMNELNGLLDALATDEQLKCVVIGAQGPSWCAGVEVADHKPEQVEEMVAVFGGIFERTHRLEVPLIAAVHGLCVGGGMEVAIACDVIIASERAKFGQPEIKLGFFPPYAVARLPELVGPAKAVEICASGKTYTALEAQKLGLVSQVLPEAGFADGVEAMVREISAGSPLIIRLNKRAIRHCAGLGFPRNLARANADFLGTLMKTQDTLEGIAAFEAKRAPVWKNR